MDFHEPIIYVDEGVKFRGSSHGWSVGDGDSSKVKLDETLDMKKNYSDLAYALVNLPQHYTDIRIHGFLGRRKDHEIMNLAEVHSLLKRVERPTRCCLDNKIMAYSKGHWVLEIKGLFSLFAFEPLKLNLSGDCEFKIKEDSTLDELSSHGLSNIGSGKIEINCDFPVFVFLTSENQQKHF